MHCVCACVHVCVCVRVFLHQLLSAASQFKLLLLQRHCELICSQHVNLDNAVGIYKTAKVTFCLSLKTHGHDHLTVAPKRRHVF